MNVFLLCSGIVVLARSQVEDDWRSIVLAIIGGALIGFYQARMDK